MWELDETLRQAIALGLLCAMLLGVYSLVLVLIARLRDARSSPLLARESRELPRPSEGDVVRSPAKAHLSDGSVVVFPHGFRLASGSLVPRKKALRYDLTRAVAAPVEAVPIEQVAFLEHQPEKLQVLPFVWTCLAPVATGAAVADAKIRKALFGSCPTIYAKRQGRMVLQAECFPYSITPPWNRRDLVRLDLEAPSIGPLTLHLKNEALETHYIRRLELLSVEVPEGYGAFVTPSDRLVLAGDERPMLSALDRDGREVRGALGGPGSPGYRSGRAILEEATDRPVRDWIDVSFPVTAGARRMAVIVGLRSSLLSTVLFYDVMLRSAGLGALDWLGRMGRNPLRAWGLNRWYGRTFGLDVETWNGSGFETEARTWNAGPLARREVAIVLPVPRGPVARVRLSFLPDTWIIDSVRAAFDVRRPRRPEALTPLSFADVSGSPTHPRHGFVGRRGRRTLVTLPGASLALDYARPGGDSAERRAHFLLSEGFYVEWMRADWVRARATGGARPAPFRPDEASVRETMRAWMRRKEELERAFFDARIPA